MKTEDKLALVKTRAQEIKTHAAINDKGEITFDKAAYLASLPEGVTEETLKAVTEHNSITFPAMVEVAGNLAIPFLKKNKDVEEVTFVAPMAAHDKFNGTIYREKEVRTPGANGEVKIVHGAVRTSCSIQGAKGSGSVMKSVTAGIAEAAAAAFGKK